MERIFAIVLTLALALPFLSGCGNASQPQSSSQREVSRDFMGFSQSGLVIANGDIKESGIPFEDTVVEFQDSLIEEMLRTILGIPEGDVRRSDLQKIHAIYNRNGRYWSDLQSGDGKLPQDGTEWYISGMPTTLADLALCGNLQWLEFSNIDLPSLEPLMDLPQLEYMLLFKVGLSPERLEELGCLPALTWLELDLRSLSSGSDESAENDGTGNGAFLLPMAQRLTYLNVKHNLTWSPEILVQLTRLESLAITAPEDLSFLAELPELHHLLINNYNSPDWSELGEAKNLTYLTLVKSSGVSLDDLRPLENLEYLTLVTTNLSPMAWRPDIIEALPSLMGLCIF